jgi:sulfonate dioxygenase
MEGKGLIQNVVNPFYSPSIQDDGDESYRYAQYKVRLLLCRECLANCDTLQPYFPNVYWEPLTEVQVTDRGLFADPSKHNLFSAAQKVKHLTPSIGTEILGIDLRKLSGPQKDEL